MVYLSKLAAASLFAACIPLDLAAIEYRGIDFPDGEASFADKVLSHAQRVCVDDNPPFNSEFVDPRNALGIPNHDPPTFRHAYSLGCGGILEVAFTDNYLANSGDAEKDLYIFEIGPDVELLSPTLFGSNGPTISDPPRRCPSDLARDPKAAVSRFPAVRKPAGRGMIARARGGVSRFS